MYTNALNMLQAARRQTLQMTAGLTDERASLRPSPGAWSVNEVLDHLLISETLYRQTIEALIRLHREGKRPVIYHSLANIDTRLPFVPASLMPLLDVPLTVMNMFVPSFVRERLLQSRGMKAIAPTVSRPTSNKTLAEVRAGLEQSVAATEALFQANSDIDFRGLRHHHPVTGANNVLQILRIVASHEIRHQGQIAEILGARQAA